MSSFNLQYRLSQGTSDIILPFRARGVVMSGISAGFKRLGGLILAGLGVATTASLGHLTVYGELPAWMAKVLAALLSLLTMNAGFALWEVLAFILGFGAVAVYLLISEGRHSANLKARVEALSQQLSIASSENAELKAKNNDLKIQLESMPDDQPEVSALTDSQYKVMMAIAKCENGRIIPTIDNLLDVTRLSRVDVMSSLDHLADIQYVKKISVYLNQKYQLTPTGRKYVLSDSFVTVG